MKHIGHVTRTLALLLGLAGAALSLPASGQVPGETYPARPVRIIVSTPAGGTVDLSARIAAEKLQQLWGQPVLVENRTGAGNNIAAEAVAKADPDGYTLLATPPSTVTVNSLLFKGLRYDPAALEPVAILATTANVLVVSNALPVRSVPELIAHAKKNPGKLTVASQGSGSTGHLTAELFSSRTGTSFVHVPFGGAAPLVMNLAGEQVDLAFVDLGTIMPMYKSGKVRIIAVAAPGRRPEIPSVPTMDESGVAGFHSNTFFALMAPPKTPAAIRTALNKAIVAAMATDARLKDIYPEPSNLGIQEMAVYLKAESRLWGDVVRNANITPE